MTNEERLKVLEYRREWYHKLDQKEKERFVNIQKQHLILLKLIKGINSNLLNTIDTYFF